MLGLGTSKGGWSFSSLFTSGNKFLSIHWDGVGFLTLAVFVEAHKKVNCIAFNQIELVPSVENAVMIKLKIKQHIEEFLKKANLKNVNRLIWLVPEKSVILRRFSLPKLGQKELRSAILLNVKKNLPYKLSEIIYSYRVVPVSEEKLDIIFYGILKEYLTETVPLDYLNTAVFVPQDLAVISLAKKLGYLPKVLFALLYDKDIYSTGVILGDAYGSFVFRDVPRKGNLSAEVELFAEYYKRQNRAVDLSSLRKVYFRFNSDQELPNCELVDVKELFAKLGLDPMKIQVLSPVGLLLSFGALFVLQEDKLFGIRYKEKKFSSNTTNSLVTAQRIWDNFLTPTRLNILIIALGCLFFISSIRFLWIYYQLANAQRHYQDLKRGLSLVAFDGASDIPDDNVINRKKQELQRKLNYYRRLRQNKMRLSPILVTIARILPHGFWLKLPFSLSQDVEQGRLGMFLNGGVYLNDAEKEMSAVDNFLSVLRKKLNKYFQQVELLFSRREKDQKTGIEYLSFSIACRRTEL